MLTFAVHAVPTWPTHIGLANNTLQKYEHARCLRKVEKSTDLERQPLGNPIDSCKHGFCGCFAPSTAFKGVDDAVE